MLLALIGFPLCAILAALGVAVRDHRRLVAAIVLVADITAVTVCGAVMSEWLA
ncbi:hypothetical protein OG897_06265 [Streptomyces sp. NBC_00237]|uniref:hypothetical protein n=1 Tax=Streptomyces sp. NBC_00237 TaxID=2975687 RepID=UPI0022545C42|nr:hypothetical protein [Streptomyces sp. NBC_00237]MCX5201066.1 hypothetical protein [Streptomyces sp. NBC_00237]